MNRRGFLTRSGLALGALIVGDEVLETLDRLTHRKVWAGHTFAPKFSGAKYIRTVHETLAGGDMSVAMQCSLDGHHWFTQETHVVRERGTIVFATPVLDDRRLHVHSHMRGSATVQVRV